MYGSELISQLLSAEVEKPVTNEFVSKVKIKQYNKAPSDLERLPSVSSHLEAGRRPELASGDKERA